MRTKIVKILVMIILGNSFLQAKFKVPVDAAGRTALANFVIKAEQEIADAQQDVYQAREYCHEYVRVKDGKTIKKIDEDTTKEKTNYTWEKRRIQGCTKDIEAKEKLAQLIVLKTRALHENIFNPPLPKDRKLLRKYLNYQDKQGKSVLHYCYTSKLYHQLVEMGAEPDPATWCYFNPCSTIAAGTAFTGFLISLTGVDFGISTHTPEYILELLVAIFK